MPTPAGPIHPEGMTYPCPTCWTPATLDNGCPGCGAPPDPEAAEVVELNAEFERQRAHVESAHQAYLAAAARLEDIWLRRNAIAARMTARITTRPKPAPPI